MTHTRTTRLFSAITATLLLTLGTATQAQTAYPAKPVRIIVPIAAGSVTDVLLRAATPMLSQRLGQPVIIDNRPGASGVVGAEACARAAADGYTICAVYHSIPTRLISSPTIPVRILRRWDGSFL